MNVKKALYFILLGLAMIGFGTQAGAQESVDVWGTPQNLSRSGAASNPRVVADENGLVHVIWLDAFDGFVYAQGDGEEWTSPRVVELPFGTRRYYPELRDEDKTPIFIPQLLSSGWGIHAFWLDDEASLYTSSVVPGEFGEFNSWLAPRKLSDVAAAYDVAVDSDGQLHLVMLRTAHSALYPAGIYYSRSVDGGSTWSAPVQLYQSIYYRLLEKGGAGLSITVGPDKHIQVAWDDPRQNEILYIQSSNEGLNWDGVKTAISRSVDEGSSVVMGNQRAMVEYLATSFAETILFWRIENGEECRLFYQVSVDFGETWTESRDFPGKTCVDIKNVLRDENDGGLLIHIGTQGSDWIIGWREGNWTKSLSLPPGFIDPARGKEVQIRSIQLLKGTLGKLLMVGGDQAGGDEIWAMSQAGQFSMDELLGRPEPVASSPWSSPEEFSSGAADSRNPAVAADSEGRFHLVWSQTGEDDAAGPGIALYYTQQDASGWVLPIPLFAYDGEKAEQPAMAIDAGDILHLVWSGGEGGEILYSRVKSNQAIVLGMWADRISLPMAGTVGSSPDIQVGPDGTIHVVYAVPVNEGRGIYYSRSVDGGSNWIGPKLVFDAARYGWAKVDHPSLAVGNDGTIHVAWSRLPLPDSLLPGGIYYIRSIDGGESWTNFFEETENESDWPQLVAVGEQEVHIAWEEESRESATITRRHCWSVDSGVSWSVPNTVPGFVGVDGPVGAVKDGAGQVHLVSVGHFAPEKDPFRKDILVLLPIQHQVWIDSQWEKVPAGSLEAIEGGNKTLVLQAAAAVALGNQLGLVYRTPGTGDGGAISFIQRQIELPEIQPTPLPTLTPTAEPTSIPTGTPMPTSPPPLNFGDSGAQSTGSGIAGEYSGLVAGVIPAGLIIIIVIIAGVWLLRRGERRK